MAADGEAFGGVSEDSEDEGKAAYKALVAGGSAGFHALLGGGRSEDDQYARLEAHGFYWTASEINPANGWSTTSVKAGWLSTVKTAVRSRELFPFGVSESDH